MATTRVTYNHPAPPEWTALADALADRVQAEHRPFDQADTAYAVELADYLDNNRLETALYHGLGLGMIGVGEAVADPERREQAAAELAAGLSARGVHLRALMDNQERLIEIGDLALPALITVGHLAQATYNSMPAHEHLASDALAITTRLRRVGASVFESGAVRPMVAGRVMSGNVSARLIASNSLAASANLHRRALLARQGVDPEFVYDDIDPLSLVKIGRQTAGLHSEEFNSSFLDDILTANANGELVFNRALLPREPHIPPAGHKKTEILHAERLGCPARNVSGLIQGVLELIPDIVRAQG